MGTKILREFNKGSMDKLRSLKYSEYGGKEPYIQKPEGFSYNATNSRITDVERFAKLLTSKPGLKFQGNQALLQQVNQLRELRKAAKPTNGKFNFKSLLKGIAKQAVKTITNNVASTASIVAQVPVNGTGTHFIRGLAPSGYLLSGAGPQTALGAFLRDVGIGGGVNGAKSVLNGQDVPTNVVSELKEKFDNSESELQRGSTTGELFPKTTLISGLTDKVGNKVLKGVVNLISKNLPIRDAGKIIRDNDGGRGFTPNQASSLLDKATGQTINVNGKSESVRPDFAFEGKQAEPYKIQGLDYTKSPVNLQNKYKLGDQGNSNSTYNGVDQINILAQQTANILESNVEDIIPFQFEVVEPGTSIPRFLYFRAFLDSLNDNYGGDWTGTKYIGRAEQFYTYQGFSREMSFSFKIAAFSKKEIIPLYKKLNFLVGTTAPTYASNGEFMKGTFTAVTIGDYISNQEGIITGVNLAWNKSYQWEIDTDQGPLLPHVLDVSVNFTPIHAFNVKSNVDSEEFENYIGGDNPFAVGLSQTGFTPVSRGIQPLPTTLPTATIPDLGGLLRGRNRNTGTVEVGEGSFGGPFDQGNFVDLGD